MNQPKRTEKMQKHQRPPQELAPKRSEMNRHHHQQHQTMTTQIKSSTRTADYFGCNECIAHIHKHRRKSVLAGQTENLENPGRNRKRNLVMDVCRDVGQKWVPVWAKAHLRTGPTNETGRFGARFAGSRKLIGTLDGRLNFENFDSRVCQFRTV